MVHRSAKKRIKKFHSQLKHHLVTYTTATITASLRRVHFASVDRHFPLNYLHQKHQNYLHLKAKQSIFQLFCIENPNILNDPSGRPPPRAGGGGGGGGGVLLNPPKFPDGGPLLCIVSKITSWIKWCIKWFSLFTFYLCLFSFIT